MHLLRAPHAGRGEVLVQAGWKWMWCSLRCFFALHAVWSTAPSGEPRYPEMNPAVLRPALVALPLQHRQAQQRLRAIHVGATLVQGPAVVEGNLRQRAADGFGKGAFMQSTSPKIVSLGARYGRRGGPSNRAAGCALWARAALSRAQDREFTRSKSRRRMRNGAPNPRDWRGLPGNAALSRTTRPHDGLADGEERADVSIGDALKLPA